MQPTEASVNITEIRGQGKSNKTYDTEYEIRGMDAARLMKGTFRGLRDFRLCLTLTDSWRSVSDE